MACSGSPSAKPASWPTSSPRAASACGRASRDAGGRGRAGRGWAPHHHAEASVTISKGSRSEPLRSEVCRCCREAGLARTGGSARLPGTAAAIVVVVGVSSGRRRGGSSRAPEVASPAPEGDPGPRRRDRYEPRGRPTAARSERAVSRGAVRGESRTRPHGRGKASDEGPAAVPVRRSRAGPNLVMIDAVGYHRKRGAGASLLRRGVESWSGALSRSRTGWQSG